MWDKKHQNKILLQILQQIDYGTHTNTLLTSTKLLFPGWQIMLTLGADIERSRWLIGRGVEGRPSAFRGCCASRLKKVIMKNKPKWTKAEEPSNQNIEYCYHSYNNHERAKITLHKTHSLSDVAPRAIMKNKTMRIKAEEFRKQKYKIIQSLTKLRDTLTPELSRFWELFYSRDRVKTVVDQFLQNLLCHWSHSQSTAWTLSHLTG